MLTKNHLLLALGLAGWAAVAAFGKTKHHAKRREHKHHKVQISTWEGEGGNLPPSTGSVTAPEAGR